MTSSSGAVDVDQVLGLYRDHVGRGRARLASMTGGVVEVESAGARVFDSAGRSYVDCGGYGVFLHGHGHPAVVAAVIDQVGRHPLGTRLLIEPTAAHAAAALAAVAPAGLERVHFVSSGAEATETAIKLARARGHTHLISARGGFHGKTTGALALTAKPVFQDPFRPLIDVTHVPYDDTEAIDAALAAAEASTGCVVLEPVQGEGGVIIPAPGYLVAVAAACRRYGAMLVLDEIQTGLGRLGRWWGADFDDVRPDLMLVGKSLSGGVIPVAAVVATPAAYEPFDRDPFLHTSTFGSAPVAMAAALAAVRVIERDGLVERARDLGSRLLARLTDILAPLRDEFVVDVRGRGLLLAVELADAGLAGDLLLRLVEAGLLANHSLTADRVIRLTPPAVLTDQDLDDIERAFVEAAGHLVRRRPSLGPSQRNAERTV